MDPHEEQRRIRELYRDCELAVREERFPDALAGFEDLRERLDAIGDRTGAGRVLLQISSVHENLSQAEPARASAACAEQIARELGDRSLLAAALHRRAHLLRMRDAAQARELFRQSSEADPDNAEGRAVSLAMIGQIDFTEGDQTGGLETMLRALAALPPGTETHEHLVEHIAYFGRRLPRTEYVRIVTHRVSDSGLRDRLL